MPAQIRLCHAYLSSARSRLLFSFFTSPMVLPRHPSAYGMHASTTHLFYFTLCFYHRPHSCSEDKDTLAGWGLSSRELIPVLYLCLSLSSLHMDLFHSILTHPSHISYSILRALRSFSFSPVSTGSTSHVGLLASKRQKCGAGCGVYLSRHDTNHTHTYVVVGARKYNVYDKHTLVILLFLF